MASAPVSEPISKLDSLRQAHWNVVVGLLWGALALLLLAWWIYSKYWETIPYMAWLIGLLGLAALGAGFFQSVQLRSLATVKPEEQEKQLAQKQSQGPLIMLGLSGVLLLLMVLLLFQVESKLVAFPEVSSGVLLALIGLLAGALLQGAPEKKLNQQNVLEGMVRNRKPFMTACLAIGGILFLLGCIVFYGYRANWGGVFPQGAGLMLVGLVFLGIGLWDMMATVREHNIASMRVLVLVAGGTIGLIVAFMTALRAYLWGDVVLTGGMSAWQGANAWQLWLCIWLELLGLGLMFGSLYLAQADIRFNVTLRRMLYGYNAVFTGLLVLAALVVLNIVVYASFPYTFNWTQSQGFYALSEKSKNILSKLKKSTTVWILMSQGSRDYTDVKNLLENCQAYTNLLDVREISPDKDTKDYQALLKRFPKLEEARQGPHAQAGRGLLIAYGYTAANPTPIGDRVPHAFIPAGDLSDDSGGGPKKFAQDQPQKRHAFKGEDLVITQLSFLIGGETKPVIYFTQSNDEIDIKNKADFPNAGSMLADKLESSNYQVRQLFFGPPGGEKEKIGENAAFSKKNADAPHKIPADAKVVVISWPKTLFAKDVLDSLEEYMKKGGKLVALCDAVDTKGRPVKTGLEPFLKKFGVDLGEDYLIRVVQNPLVCYPVTLIPVKAVDKSNNPIARAFYNQKFAFDTPRSVKPLPPTGGGSFTAEAIFEAPISQGDILWAETDLKTLDDTETYVIYLKTKNKLYDKESKEPIPVAVAVSDRDHIARAVVIGNGFIASNRLGGSPAQDLIVSSIEWLGERPQNIGIAPKLSNYYVLPVQNINRQRMILLPFGLMVLGLIGVGMGVWVVRRP